MGILAEFYQTVAAPLEDTDPRKAEILQVVAGIPSDLDVTVSAGFDSKIGELYEVGSPGYIVDAMISRAAILRHTRQMPEKNATDIIKVTQDDYPFIKRAVHVSNFFEELNT